MGEGSGSLAEAGHRRWLFANAVLDERTLELSVGGEVVPIERKPLEVLQYLLHHAGEAVTKRELEESLWPGRILTETVLTRCISLLRQVLQDQERTLIRTVHGYGYRLTGDVRVEASTAPPPPAFNFRAGDSPPLRKHWALIERLGQGGHGEVWLARHRKTGDERVFKFALSEQSLASLKREITINRLLSGCLTNRGVVVRFDDWNLEEPPYFIEMEYVVGRDLLTWSTKHGGLASVQLERRLHLAAQIADATEAAHSVGVLHKDLKPANVLVVEDEAGHLSVKLSDFGSGSVCDARRLHNYGITNLGFTSTADARADATALYLAPEVLAGQPFTRSADVYALGMMLYQLVVGDFRRTLAPGWENNINDDLLREDIAIAAAGDPSLRLSDAAQLAVRLKSLAGRHEARSLERAARARSERTQRIMSELTRTRAFAAAVLVFALASLLGGVLAYTASNEAMAARAKAEAVNAFLLNDLFSIDPRSERPRDATYNSLLVRAADQIGVRFNDQPDVAANLHWLIGRRLQEAGQTDAAQEHYERAANLSSSEHSFDASLWAQDRLIPLYVNRGWGQKAVALGNDLVARWTRLYGSNDMSTLLLRARVARQKAFAGEFSAAEKELRTVLHEVARSAPPSAKTHEYFRNSFGLVASVDTSALASHNTMQKGLTAHVSAFLGAYLVQWADERVEAEALYRTALDTFQMLLPTPNEPQMMSLLSLGVLLGRKGAHNEARQLLAQGTLAMQSMFAPSHWQFAVAKYFWADLYSEMGQPQVALPLLKTAIDICIKDQCPAAVASEIRFGLGETHLRTGNYQSALEVLRQSQSWSRRHRGVSHLDTLRRSIAIAEALRISGQTTQALRELTAIPPGSLRVFERHTVLADFLRVRGLIARQQNQSLQAQRDLAESRDILNYRWGPSHWRSQRARREYAGT